MSSRDHPDWWRPVGGQNSQDSTLERRSLIWNDSDIEDGTVPGTFYEAETYKGKFFTRGCRGMLEQLQIYCMRTAVMTITLRYSPHPCLGPFRSVTIMPGLAWGWVDIPILEMWDYDSLFIWVHSCGANAFWAYDAELPFDGHESGDAGATWSDMAIRPFIRAVYTGETPGDVPVSGIVNVIKMPNTALEAAIQQHLNVPNAAWTDIVTLVGAGELVQAQVYFETAVAPAAGVEYMVVIHADGYNGIIVRNRQLTQSVVATSGRCAMGEFFQDADDTWLWTRLPLQYRRTLLIRVYQSSGAAVDVTVTIMSNELR